MGCAKFIFLVVILYYRYAKCCHWGNWAKDILGLSVLFLTTICESSQNKKLKQKSS